MSINLFFTLFLLCAFDNCVSLDMLSSVCEYCSKYKMDHTSEDLFKQFCKHGNITGRCCLQNKTIVGLDASDCQLKSTDFVSIAVKAGLVWLSYVNNDAVTNLAQWNGLRSMTNLTTLVVSTNVLCNSSFQHFMHIGNVTICQDPVRKCEMDHNYCPENSHCLRDGPGLGLCLCNEDWRGYRCLKKGKFSAVEWLVGFSVATIVICITLRFVQRNGRKAGELFKELNEKKIRDNSLNSHTPAAEVYE